MSITEFSKIASQWSPDNTIDFTDAKRARNTSGTVARDTHGKQHLVAAYEAEVVLIAATREC